MPYEVRTEVFDGPFDVLLRLITEQRVDLYDVRLSDIVDSFLEEIKQLEKVDLEVATEFLLIAAILVELKSRRLLPDPDTAVSEQDLALLEERDYLLARLVECTAFSAAGKRLAELEHDAVRSVPRSAGPDERFEAIAPDLMVGVTPDLLRECAERVLAERPAPVVDLAHVLVDEVTVADVVERLVEILPRLGPITFRKLTAEARHRIEAVVHFLALLELYKQELVELEQALTFGDLVISWVGPAVEVGPAGDADRGVADRSGPAVGSDVDAVDLADDGDRQLRSAVPGGRLAAADVRAALADADYRG